MKSLNRNSVIDASPKQEKILMFGEGNFLRAFAALLVHRLNETGVFDGGITALQGTEQGFADMINAQQGLYHVIERGVEGGKAVNTTTLVKSLNRCINPYLNYSEYIAIADNPDLEVVISNTTEFGICYDETEKSGAKKYSNFPAKLTDFLHKRYLKFEGASDKGLIILPCELIDRNGDKLKAIIERYSEEWGLGDGFLNWLREYNIFANTLVDRIVSGYPKTEAAEICERIGFQDNLIDVCEPFFLWAIEGDTRITDRIPLDKGGLDVVITDNLEFYRTRKVRILNGAHTMSVLAGHLAGLETVEQMIKDKDFSEYITYGLEHEIIPCMQGEGLYEYAASVKERFLNPYLNHRLLSIALNSISKFKSRVLPSIEDYVSRVGYAPACLSLGLAALIAFYQEGMDTVVNDEAQYIGILKDIFASEVDEQGIVLRVLAREEFWGKDLNQCGDLTAKTIRILATIKTKGIRAAIREAING